MSELSTVCGMGWYIQVSKDMGVCTWIHESSSETFASIWSELKLNCKERKCDIECSFSEMELVLGSYSGTSAGSFLGGIGSILFIPVLTYAMHAEAKK